MVPSTHHFTASRMIYRSDLPELECQRAERRPSQIRLGTLDPAKRPDGLLD